MNFKFPKLITAMAVFAFTSGVFAQIQSMITMKLLNHFFILLQVQKLGLQADSQGINTGKILLIMYLMYLLMMQKTKSQEHLKLLTLITVQTN
jgi:hypothetical protein